MLKVDIRNRLLKPKVGEIITVIGDMYTTVAEQYRIKVRGVKNVLFMIPER